MQEEEIREVRCNICAATQTEGPSLESEEWHDWVQNTIVEDDALFCSAAATSGEEQGRRSAWLHGNASSAWNHGGSDPVLDPEPAALKPHAGDEYQRSCAKCREALGLRRPHKHGKSESTNVLSADLSGPHPEAVGTKFQYMLVAVFNPGRDSPNLPFVRGLTSKTAKEVCKALHSILGELSSMVGEQIVVRFHTDAGKEFLNNAVKDLMTELHIMQTKLQATTQRQTEGPKDS